MGRGPLSLSELQDVERGILKALKAFCDEHHLRYYLCGGTLLGAIRHEGFIPWDDDIDVMMPRPDYERFIELNNDGSFGEYYVIDSMRINDGALSSIARIYDKRTELVFRTSVKPRVFGCWIDVFPLDGLSNSRLGRFLQFRYARIVQTLTIINGTKLGVKRRSKLHTVAQYGVVPFLPFIRLVGHDRYNKWMDKISTRHAYSSSKFVGVLEGRALEKEAMVKSEMEPPALVLFDGDEYTAMANYDEYLTSLYGDYMTPPDEAGKESRHVIEVYWKDACVGRSDSGETPLA